MHHGPGGRKDERLTPGELRDAAWRVLEPYFEQRLNALLDDYGEARGHGRGPDRLEEIAAALAQSRWVRFWWRRTARFQGSGCQGGSPPGPRSRVAEAAS